MSVCSCICFDFTASWTGASADEVCQYYGGQPYHHGCECVLNLSYDHYYYDADHHSRYVHVKATVHIYVCTYSAFHYYQYLCRILLWCVRCQYGASDNYFYESSG